MSQIIAALEAEQMEGKQITPFRIGDTVVVYVKVKEGNRERLQAFEGVVIAKRNRGLNSAFTVRKISHGEGVERVFQTYSPLIDSVELKRQGEVRRAKLYYLRDLKGRKARIKEKIEKSKPGDLKGSSKKSANAANTANTVDIKANAAAVDIKTDTQNVDISSSDE